MAGLQKIKLLLSSRFSSYFILLISIAGRVIQKIHFAGAGGDKAYQLQSTKNMLQGHGISIYQSFADNLSHAEYIPLIKWPPGYSILMTVFYSSNHFLWGSLWPDIISAILFVWLARKIILLFKVSPYLANLYCIVSGFFLYEFCLFPSTDLIALVLYQAALYLVLKMLIHPTEKHTTTILIAISLFACGFLRYIFIPVSLVIPLYFIASGLINHNRRLTKHGIIILLVLVSLVSALLLFQKWHAGTAIYIAETSKGFYPSHILRISPFLFSSFINTELASVQLERITGLDYLTIGKFMKGLHLAILLTALLLFFQWLFRKRMISPSPTGHFIYIGSFSALAIITSLSYLSLTNAPAALLSANTWSFVDETRYYSIIVFFVQQLLFIWVSHSRHLPGKVSRFLVNFCLVLLFLFTAHSVYYTILCLTRPGINFFYKKNELEAMDYTRHLLHKVIADNPGKSVVFSSGDPMFNNFAAMWEDIPGLYDFKKLNTLQVASEKEVIIFVSVRDRDEFRLRGFVENRQTQKIGQINDYSFYILNISPRQAQTIHGTYQ